MNQLLDFERSIRVVWTYLNFVTDIISTCWESLWE